MLNPLAIGVTVSGRLLDVVVPRPKPRVGLPVDVSPLSSQPGSRTLHRPTARVHHHGAPVASGSSE
jgi:hypothetical protein